LFEADISGWKVHPSLPFDWATIYLYNIFSYFY
jgi:hypothetical protein